MVRRRQTPASHGWPPVSFRTLLTCDRLSPGPPDSQDLAERPVPASACATLAFRWHGVPEISPLRRSAPADRPPGRLRATLPDCRRLAPVLQSPDAQERPMTP